MNKEYYTTREIKKIFKVRNTTSLADCSDVRAQIERVGHEPKKGRPIKWRIKSKSPFCWITSKNGDSFDSATGVSLRTVLRMAAIALANGSQIQMGPTDNTVTTIDEDSLTPI